MTSRGDLRDKSASKPIVRRHQVVTSPTTKPTSPGERTRRRDWDRVLTRALKLLDFLASRASRRSTPNSPKNLLYEAGTRIVPLAIRICTTMAIHINTTTPTMSTIPKLVLQREPPASNSIIRHRSIPTKCVTRLTNCSSQSVTQRNQCIILDPLMSTPLDPSIATMLPLVIFLAMCRILRPPGQSLIRKSITTRRKQKE